MVTHLSGETTVSDYTLHQLLVVVLYLTVTNSHVHLCRLMECSQV